MMRALSLLLLVTVWQVSGVSVLELTVSADELSVDDTEQASAVERDERQSFFAQFARVTETDCTGYESELEGKCKKQADCTSSDGEMDGACSQAFAFCCVYKPGKCGSQLKTSVGYLQSEDFPNGTSEGGCSYSIAKYSTDVVQLKIEFLVVELAGPTLGECMNDTMQITGVDYPNNMNIPLCGSLTDNDPIYLSVKNTDSDTRIIFDIGEDSDARWRIKVTQLTAEEAAPPLCLKYYTEQEGIIRSFNHQDGIGEWLGNLNYAMCIKMQQSFCDISFTSNHFDIGDGKLCFGTECATGNEFPLQLMYNCTNGPPVFSYMSGTTNDDQGSGFELTYQLQPNNY